MFLCRTRGIRVSASLLLVFLGAKVLGLPRDDEFGNWLRPAGLGCIRLRLGFAR